jgi:hypothetical protein
LGIECEDKAANGYSGEEVRVIALLETKL